MSNKVKYHFLYKTTNLINGKYYYGMHSTYKLNDGYLGSGKILRYSIRKYGKENFSIEIIDFFSSREDLVNAEMNLITEEMVINNDLCMNLKKGGLGGIINDKHHKNMRTGSSTYQKNKWLDDEYREKMITLYSMRMKEHHLNKKIKYAPFTDKKHSDETKHLMSESRKGTGLGEKNSQFGTLWITKDGLNKKIKKEELENYLNDGWIKGRKIK